MSTIGLRIYLVRHGETQENREGIIQGQKNTELNEVGSEQVRLLGESLKDVKFSFAFSSDLRRAYNTAEAIMEHHGDIEIVKVVEIRERGMGDLEGKKFSKGMRLAMAMDDTVEPASSFSKRLSKWWNERILQSVLSKSKEEEVNVLVVTHGGVIGTLVRDLLGSRKITAGKGVVVVECMNASVTVVELEYGSIQGVLVRYGDVTHLGGLGGGINAAADQLASATNSRDL